jgi:hypothetical protein
LSAIPEQTLRHVTKWRGLAKVEQRPPVPGQRRIRAACDGNIRPWKNLERRCHHCAQGRAPLLATTTERKWSAQTIKSRWTCAPVS